MAFEEEFGSEISDSEAEKILTVGDAIKFIEENQLNIKKCLNRGKILLILSSPSGAGKTTLTKNSKKKS